MLALSSLFVMTACTSSTQLNPTAAAATPSGSTELATNNMQSVNAVSDALGRRLDGMLTPRQASR
jgi:hypothetical protein